MFLKPKTSQLNKSATLYKEILDITRYINATTVFRTTLLDTTYKYWVYDTDNAKMVEIENKNYDSVINVTNDKGYYFNGKYWLWQNDNWKQIYANFESIQLTNDYYYNYPNFIDSDKKTILDYFKEYEALIEKKAQIDADLNGNSIEKITLELPIGNGIIVNTPSFLNLVYEKDLLWNVEMISFKYYSTLTLNPPITTRYIYLDNNGNIQVNFPVINLNFHDYTGDLFMSEPYIDVLFDDSSEILYDVELPYYRNMLALFFNDVAFRDINLPIDNNFVDKQQKVFYLNKGEFDYCVIDDINVVNQQIIKGLNVEFKTFDIKTSSDIGIGNQDIVKILDTDTNTYEYYITSEVNYKTIRLPKPLRYTFCTLTQLKTK